MKALRRRGLLSGQGPSRSWALLALCAGSSFLALAPLEQAQAQSAAAPAATSKDNNTVSEVVVTAEYRAENVQKTPISITAINAQTLEQRGVTNIVDLASSVPNVTMRMGGSGSGLSNQTFIRGIGQSDFLFAYSPRIAFYVDGVYFATVYGSTFDLLDVDHIDVERGPQGVLSGRNAAGGAINIVSKKPDGNDGGYVEATGGSLSRFDIKGAIDQTLVPDKLFLRLSGMHEQHDGWVKLENFACENPTLAGKLPNKGTNTSEGCDEGTLGAVNDWAVRGQLRWTPTEHIEDNLSVDYTNSHDTASPDVLTAPLQFNTYDPHAATALVPGNPGSVNQPNGLGTWFGNVGGPDYGLALSNNCLVGSTYFGFTPAAFAPRSYCTPTPALAAALYPNNPFVSYASFGNPGLSGTNPAGENLPAGAPNYLDSHSGFQDPNVYNLKQWGFSNTLDIDLLPWLHFKSTTAARGYSGVFGSSQEAIALPIQESFQGVSHHQFSEEVVFTGKFWNRLDWTAGGINGRPFNTTTDIFPYGPETVKSYEVGLKTELLDHHLRLNGDVFQEDYTNIQVTQLGSQCGCSHTNTVFFTANGGNARIRGFELEAEAHPIGGLVINGSIGYNKFQYTSILPGVSLSLSSPQLFTPDWTINAGAQYGIDLGHLGTLTPRIDVTWQSTVHFTATELDDPLQNQPSYGLVNARLTWRPTDGKWTLSGAVTNLGDKLYYTQKFNGLTGFGTATGQVGMPREFTVSVRRSF